MKTDAEYIKNPSKCPFCDSDDIIAQEWDGDLSSQRVYCNTCNKSWADLYKLTGYTELD